MKYFKKYVLLSVIFFCACETQVDVSGRLDQQQLTVINGYISPQDETLIVQVSQSISKFESFIPSNDQLVIKEAIVTIRDEDNKQVELLYNATTFQYEVASEMFPIESGEQYFLSVMVDNKEYTSTATVPTDQVTDIDKDFFEDQFGIDRIKIKFKDVPVEKNFYVVGVDFSNDDGQRGSTYFYEQRFVTDANRDGTTLTSSGEINFFGDGTGDEIPYTIQVANVERILYDALRASFLFSDGEDILIEPVVFPTNIKGENGFGVFAGYNLTEKEEVFTP